VLETTIFHDAEMAERELRLAEQLAQENPVFFHLTTNLLAVYPFPGEQPGPLPIVLKSS
jgi:hypothetical protein